MKFYDIDNEIPIKFPIIYNGIKFEEIQIEEERLKLR